ncbi:unnamed protein product, partial [Didymodactylos carnosus]
EFHRRPRSIQRCNSWKAQEYRIAVLYLFPIILYDVLSIDHYGHVLLFVCSIRLLHCDYVIDIANILLKAYEKAIYNYYGKKLSTMILHVSKEYLLHGSLSSTSCFPLEGRIQFYQRDGHGISYLIKQIIDHYETELTIKSIQAKSNNKYDEDNAEEMTDRLSDQFRQFEEHVCRKCKEKIVYYQRMKLQRVQYHARCYARRGPVNNYTIAYNVNNRNICEFGYIDFFIKCKCGIYTSITKLNKFKSLSCYVKQSRFLPLLQQVLDYFFYIVQESSETDTIKVENIWRKSVICSFDGNFLISPVSATYEHD